MLVKLVFRNFFEYNYLIFLVAIIDAFFCGASYVVAKKLRYELEPTQNKAVWRGKPTARLSEQAAEPKEQSLIEKRKISEFRYALFSNIIAVFPLLGILGTVISLLQTSLSDMQQNFLFALTSTFWGLVFAIFGKILDALLSPYLDQNSKMVDLFLERRPEESAKEPAYR